MHRIRAETCSFLLLLRNFSGQDLRENLEVRLAPKGRMSAKHDEENHTQRPNVHLGFALSFEKSFEVLFKTVI